jgi:ABC-type branched-subunit amino acid transport system substrate-binding protein
MKVYWSDLAGKIFNLIKILMIFLIIMPLVSAASEKNPIRIGLTAEFGLPNSTSAQAVKMGIRVALHEINTRGGVLGGRPLILEVADDRSVPARGIENIKEFSKMKDHAYDLTHLLALAIEKAGSTDRAAIRTALENLGSYQGLAINTKRPFTPENHDALGQEYIFMAKYREDGVLIPIP